jgi:hypothetical protein
MVVLPKNLNATKIDLSGSGIKEIPPEVFTYKNLKKLFLRNNKIARIPQEISKLKRLTVLDISNNILTSMHAKIFDLKKLEVLILNNNKIKNIPFQIRNLKRLRILGLAHNKFVGLNANLNFLTELKELNLSENNFNEFPHEILNQKTLERLWLCRCDINIPELRELKNDLPYLKKIYKSNAFDMGKPQLEGKRTQAKIKKKIFISYSHQDRDWLERVKKHIKVLSLYKADCDSDFELWDDDRIRAGNDWKKEINKALNESTAAILLISTDFLGSDFIKNEELQPLLEKAGKGGTLILPLILSPCRFLKIPSLSKYHSINNPETEVLTRLTIHQQDVILEKLTDEVERYINANS